MFAHQRYVAIRANTTFRYYDPIVWNTFYEIQRCLQTDFKGTQVSIIDTHQWGIEPQRTFELSFIMDLHQYVEVQFARQRRQLGHMCIAKRSNDEQYAISPDRPRLIHLIEIHGEILAQYR